MNKKWKRRRDKYHDNNHYAGSGYVYILTNQHFKQDILKIGFTRRDPQDRAFELYDGVTGVPGEFKVEFSVWVTDCEFTEQKLHDLLAQFRVNANREFFNVPLHKAIELTQRVAEIVNEEKRAVMTMINCNSCGKTNNIKGYRGEDDDRRIKCGSCGASLPIGRVPTWNKETGKYE
jgi:hypothetical protein